MYPVLQKGQIVEVSHLQGKETGIVESVNYKTGKVLVFFDDVNCPHFDSFNLDQIRPFPLKATE